MGESTRLAVGLWMLRWTTGASGAGWAASRLPSGLSEWTSKRKRSLRRPRISLTWGSGLHSSWSQPAASVWRVLVWTQGLAMERHEARRAGRRTFPRQGSMAAIGDLEAAVGARR